MTEDGQMKRKGFTMIELLVVMGVATILLSMMLPSFNTSRNTARADNVITNMSNLAAAFQMAYADNPDKFRNAPVNESNSNNRGGKRLSADVVSAYVDNFHAEDGSKYDFVFFDGVMSSDRYGWWVRYKLTGDTSELRTELADRIVSSPALGIYSYKTEGNISIADKKNIISGNLYLILKAR